MLSAGKLDLKRYLDKYGAQTELEVIESDIQDDEGLDLEIWTEHDAVLVTAHYISESAVIKADQNVNQLDEEMPRSEEPKSLFINNGQNAKKRQIISNSQTKTRKKFSFVSTAIPSSDEDTVIEIVVNRKTGPITIGSDEESVTKKPELNCANPTILSSDEETEPLPRNIHCPPPNVLLNDEHILPALMMLKTQFPSIGGLIDTLLLTKDVSFNFVLKEKNVFIAHVNRSHWVIF